METPDLSQIAAIYTDGGVIWDGRGTASSSIYGGTWAWRGVAFDGETVIFEQRGTTLCPDPTHPVTNNLTEQIAIIKALQQMPTNWSGVILTDSNVAKCRVISDYQIYSEGSRRAPAGEKGLWGSISKSSKEVVIRLGELRFILLEGHPSQKHIKACKENTDMQEELAIDFKGDARFLDGIGLKRGLPISHHNDAVDKMCKIESDEFKEMMPDHIKKAA